MTTLRLALTGFLCLGILCCCSTTKERKPADAPDTAGSASSGTATGTLSSLPADFSCRVGFGGGITGLWSGYTLEADGTVLSWEGRIAGLDPQPAGQIPTEAVQRLWQLVQDRQFMTLRSDTRGNMTYMIEVTAGGRTHTAWWSAEARPAKPDLNRTLTELRSSLLDVLSRAGSEQH